jgi:hypothetical protein
VCVCVCVCVLCIQDLHGCDDERTRDEHQK